MKHVFYRAKNFKPTLLENFQPDPSDPDGSAGFHEVKY
jgi:hypothetical protein